MFDLYVQPQRKRQTAVKQYESMGLHSVYSLLELCENWSQTDAQLLGSSSNMAEDDSSNKNVSKNHRHSLTGFKEQLKILINTFNQKPYLGYGIIQKLASEINTEESRIQVYFRIKELGNNSRKDQNLRKLQNQAEGMEKITLKNRLKIFLTWGQNPDSVVPATAPSQLQTLIKTFTNNPYPETESREQLAKKIGFLSQKSKFGFKTREQITYAEKKKI